MELPRCGVTSASDTEDTDDSGASRKKRFAVEGSRWARTDLTYKILNFSPDMDQSRQESETAKALNVRYFCLQLNKLGDSSCSFNL